MRCPAGHESSSTDYCDTCGVAMDAAPAAPADSPGTSTDQMPVTQPIDVATGECPNCQTTNPANALFCENCGYDFTTGALPRAADPLTPPPDDTPVAGTPVVEQATTPPAEPKVTAEWVAEIWIDADWYADQEATDPLPSPGLPTVVPLTKKSNLIGRTSQSRGIHPELDLGSDNGISRRHAQLTTDGSRWFVEDLGSSNGTFVAPPGPLPKTPIPVGQKKEIAPDDRVYLGAWTRLILRRAAPGEV